MVKLLKNDVIYKISKNKRLIINLIRLPDVLPMYKFSYSIQKSVTLGDLKKWIDINVVNNKNFNLNHLSDKELSLVSGGKKNSRLQASVLSGLTILCSSRLLPNNNVGAISKSYQHHQNASIKSKSKNISKKILNDIVLPVLPSVPIGLAIGTVAAYYLCTSSKHHEENEPVYQEDQYKKPNLQHKSKKVKPVLPFKGLLNNGMTCFGNALVQLLHGLPGFKERLIQINKNPYNSINLVVSEIANRKENIDNQIKKILKSYQFRTQCKNLYNLLENKTFTKKMRMLNNNTDFPINNFLRGLAAIKDSGHKNLEDLDNIGGLSLRAFIYYFRFLFLDSTHQSQYSKNALFVKKIPEIAKKHNLFSKQIRPIVKGLVPLVTSLEELSLLSSELSVQYEDLTDQPTQSENLINSSNLMLKIFNTIDRTNCNVADIGEFTSLWQSTPHQQEDPIETLIKMNLSAILPIHLCKVNHNNLTNWFNNLNSVVSPEDYFLVSLNQGSSYEENPHDLAPKLPATLNINKKTYILTAIVKHSGSRLGGHCTTYRLDPKTNNWWYCDDACVSHQGSNILECDDVKRGAYILAYQKI